MSREALKKREVQARLTVFGREVDKKMERTGHGGNNKRKSSKSASKAAESGSEEETDDDAQARIKEDMREIIELDEDDDDK